MSKKSIQESTATIKLTKSEIEWNIIALVYAQSGADHFEQWDNAKMYKKLREDFIKIKNDIIDGENDLEKNYEKDKKDEIKIRTGK